MSITDGLRTVIEFRISNITGAQGVGFHRLQFSFEAELAGYPEPSALIHELRMFVAAGPARGVSKPLGTAIPQISWQARTNAEPRRTHLLAFVDLSSEQLSALERMRAGNPLAFRFDVSALVECARGTQPGFEQLTYEIPVSTWAEVLKTLGYSELLLVALELPATGVPVQLEEAVHHLREAHEHLTAGRYNTTVACCRMVIEAVHAVLYTSTQIDQALHEFETKRSQMTKRARALVVSAAVRNYAHLAHHVSHTAKAEVFSRQDALFILAATCAAVWDATGELAAA